MVEAAGKAIFSTRVTHSPASPAPSQARMSKAVCRTTPLMIAPCQRQGRRSIVAEASEGACFLSLPRERASAVLAPIRARAGRGPPEFLATFPCSPPELAPDQGPEHVRIIIRPGADARGRVEPPPAVLRHQRIHIAHIPRHR